MGTREDIAKAEREGVDKWSQSDDRKLYASKIVLPDDEKMFCTKCKKETKSIKHGTRRYIGAIYQMEQCIECGHTQKTTKIKDLVKA